MEQVPNLKSLRLNALVNGRLGSLGTPRDLTLGGTKNNKKIFKPNLNVVRRKEIVKEPVDKASPNKKDRKKPYQKKERPKINNAKSGRFIQSSSVFSEGLAAGPPVIRSDRYLSHRDHDAAAVIEAPTIVKSSWNIDKRAEENVINDLLLVDDEDDSSEEDAQYMPVLLPLHENKLGFRKHFNIKQELKIEIKKEKADASLDETSSGSSSVKIMNGPSISVKSESTAPTLFNGVKKYDDDDMNVSLIKMPDSLPGKGFLPDSDEPADFTLNQMVEGQIGKILIRKSGKIEVMIGNTKYDLEAEEPPGFVEDVMAMPDEKTANNKPHMVHLTSITDRFVLSPSWDTLLKQHKKL